MNRLTGKRESPLVMSMWAGDSQSLRIYNRLAAIEDILGDEYELDRVRELVKADREGRCVVMPIKVPGWGWCCNDKFPNAISAYFGCPSQVVDCMEDYILRGTKEQAEAALKAREQDEH